jgi:hypothetical protein
MMRLRELEATSPLLDKAKALVSSVDAVPESPERLVRLRRELDRPRARFTFARRLPAFSAAGVLLLFGASAFAALRLFGPVGSQSASRSNTVPPKAAEVVRHRAAPSDDPAPSPQLVEAPSKPDPAPAPLPHGAAKATRSYARHGHKLSTNPRARHAAQHARRAPSLTPPIAAPRQAALEPEQSALSPLAQAVAQPTEPSSEASQVAPAVERQAVVVDEPQTASAAQPTPAARDSELVHRALKALRHDHDPALAASLLEQQRARYGNGPLAEEALALQIEASALLKQDRSRELARDYLARYPNGRYRSIVQRALQDAGL